MVAWYFVVSLLVAVCILCPHYFMVIHHSSGGYGNTSITSFFLQEKIPPAIEMTGRTIPHSDSWILTPESCPSAVPSLPCRYQRASRAGETPSRYPIMIN